MGLTKKSLRVTHLSACAAPSMTSVRVILDILVQGEYAVAVLPVTSNNILPLLATLDPRFWSDVFKHRQPVFLGVECCTSAATG